MKKIDTNRVAKLVINTLSKRLKGLEIVKVNVVPDLDRDGDDILRIGIIFKGELREADAKLIAGATREIWPLIESEIDDDLFPLLSFVSKVDYDRGRKFEIH